MNKTEWDMMTSEEKYDLIKDKVFNGHLFVMKHRSVGATEFAMNNIISNFTTDRNSCALVLKEIEQRGPSHRASFAKALSKVATSDAYWMTLGTPGQFDPEYVVPLLLIDPDIICYCAVKAVEE